MANKELKIYTLDEAGLASLAQAVSDAPKAGGGGNGGGDGLDARLAKVEATIGHIQSDISEIKKDIRETRGDWKILMGAIATTFVLLAGAGAAAYMNLGDKLFKMNESLTVIIEKLQ
ncbi:MAG: hypothetical protein H8E36_01475 [Rhodospirillaceae bacterium]|nr:hypothetical protein [Rhodospirillaceae bacterium]MBL6942686.1 hypothetical protein [Rhodospirillales bacterium]